MQTSAKVELEALGNEIAEMAAHIDAAMHRLLTAIRKFDLENGWHAQGALSCAHWLAWRIGWDLRTARERLRVARKLAELPSVDEHLRTGAMSYSQARAISRVADGSNEKLWVEYAKRMPASQLDKLCSSFQSVKGYADGASTMTVAAPRSVTRRTIDHGMVKIELVLTNDDAAIVWQLLDAVRNQTSEPRGTQTPAEPRATNGTSGSAQTPAEPPMANTASASAQNPAEPTGAIAASSAAQTPAEPRAPFVPSPPLSPAERSTRRADAFMTIIHDQVRGTRATRTPVEVIVTVPHANLHGSAEPADHATFADGDLMAASTAQRLCCDAGIVVATVNDRGQPLSIGRKTRSIPPAIKRALLLRDRTCRFPGCTHRSYVDGHHVEHWANGGKTELGNLMLLCTAHHRLLHEGGFRVEPNAIDGWHFFDERNRRVQPLPPRIPTLPPTSRPRPLGLDTIRDDKTDLDITADTHAMMWTGEPVDYGTCIDYLV